MSQSFEDYFYILEDGESVTMKGVREVEAFVARGLGVVGFDEPDVVIAKGVERIECQLPAHDKSVRRFGEGEDGLLIWADRLMKVEVSVRGRCLHVKVCGVRFSPDELIEAARNVLEMAVFRDELAERGEMTVEEFLDCLGKRLGDVLLAHK